MYLIILALKLAALTHSSAVDSARSCETIGPRLDGTYVTICAGSVVRTADTAPSGGYIFLAPGSR